MIAENDQVDGVEVEIKRIHGEAALVTFARDGRHQKAIVEVSSIGPAMTIPASILDVAVLLPNIEDLLSPDVVRRRFEDGLLNMGICFAHQLLEQLPAVRGALASAYSDDLVQLVALAKRQRRRT